MIPDLEVISKGQCFPLYWYEKKDKSENALGLELDERKGDYIRRNAITDFAWNQFRQAYGDSRIPGKTSSTTFTASCIRRNTGNALKAT